LYFRPDFGTNRRRRRHTLPDLPRTLITAVVLVAVACATALVHNAVRADGIPLIRPDAMASDGENGPILPLARAKKLYDDGAVFVDSRTAEEFAEGHIEGARLLYYEDAEQDWEKVMAGVDPSRPVVAYCSGEGCNSSYMVAEQLRDVGYEQVYVFHGGWPAWVAAGYAAAGRNPHLKIFEFDQ